jgi:hypothetical protein
MIERKLIIGCITSTDFLKDIEDEWNPMYIESRAGRVISDWCWEYFKQYRQAPMQEIETIYVTKLKKGIDKELAEEIDEEILPNLSEEYVKERNTKHLVEKARDFFIERQLQLHSDAIQALLSKGKVDEAKKLQEGFKLKEKVEIQGLDLSTPLALERVKQAFDQEFQSVLKFPGALGEFINDDLVRGGFIGIQAPEKRGKTFLLLEFMMQAYEQGKRVAFFQAGDMTEAQQIIRIGIYLTQTSNKEKYCGTRYIPVQDCIMNQKDTCNRKIRACDFGLFGEEMDTRKDITKEDLVEAYDNNPDYKPCYNCLKWSHSSYGTPYLKKIEVKKPLTRKGAMEAWKKFFVQNKRIKLISFNTGTLTPKVIESTLDGWKEKEGFAPDLVLVDYADIVESDMKGEFRHQENDKWKKFRGLSQKTNALWIIPTQADSDSYNTNTLSLKNFSEDKRKYGHVTAMYGLNQDKEGREKEIGIIRINKILLREGEFVVGQCVHVLQHLAIGRPFLGSYF